MVTIRPAVESDVPTIHGLILDLARFENLLSAVHVTEETLRRDGFGADPKFECLLAENAGPEGPEAVGLALYFTIYSTFAGRAGLYLEDLVVAESARGLGVGRRLIERMAQIAIERDCGRMDLSALHWNPARKFYEALGAEELGGWLQYRFGEAALRRLAHTQPDDE